MTPKKYICYIAGPMTGIPAYNFPAFDAARDMLSEQGHYVMSPADLDRENGFDAIQTPDKVVTAEFVRAARKRDIEAIEMCDAIYMLEGWEDSVGARAELAYAQWCGHTVMYQTPSATNPCDATHGNGSEIQRLREINGVKDTANPKGIEGAKKCPMHLLPPTALEQTAWVHNIGNKKYGPWNWRDKPINAEVYVAATLRHVNAWHTGEDLDPESGVSHLAHVAANMNILMDAIDNDCLIDDRPVKKLHNPVRELSRGEMAYLFGTT